MDVSSSEKITNEDWALFKETLTSNSYGGTEVQIQTIKHMTSLAKALGPQRTRDDLLSFLSEEVENFNDEILYTVSDELEYFLPLIGGSEYSHEILSILLKISRAVDETFVRKRAIDSIKKIFTSLDHELSEEYFVTSLVNLEEDHFSLADKSCSLSLIPVCYLKSSPKNKTVMRQKYLHLLEDDSGLVRELAASELSEFISNLEIESILEEFVPMLYRIADTSQDSIRINAIEVSLSVAKKSKCKEVQSEMLNIILKSSCDSSWQIRQHVALLIDEIVQIFDDEEFISTLLDIYENLVDDVLMEVRIFAARNAYNFAKNLFSNLSSTEGKTEIFENMFLEKFIPILVSMKSDESNDVQIALSSSLLFFSTILSNHCFELTILPIIIDCLENDKPLIIKENILKNLDFLPPNINIINSITTMNQIIHSILMNSGTCWRARRSILVTLLHISKFCSGEYFKTNLLVYYIILLKDNVYAVRRTASLILPILAKRFGLKWLINEIIPHIHHFLKDGNYLYRYILLFCIQELINPSINETEMNEEYYLMEIKDIPQEFHADYLKSLCRVIRLNFKLRNHLSQKNFDNILNSYEDINNIHGENIRNYSEELLDTIIKYNTDITMLKNGEFHTEKICFLEGLLVLLNGEIMNVLKILTRDPISNIHDRAKYSLLRIKQFSDNLNKEIEQEWVKKFTGQVTEAKWKEINQEISEYMEDVKTLCEGVEEIEIDASIIRSPSMNYSSNASLEIIEILEKQEVFPTDCSVPRDIRIEEMESVDEEKGNITSL